MIDDPHFTSLISFIYFYLFFGLFFGQVHDHVISQTIISYVSEWLGNITRADSLHGNEGGRGALLKLANHTIPMGGQGKRV